MKKLLTEAQVQKAASQLKKLIEMPQVKDLLQQMLMAKCPKDDEYRLYLRKTGVVKMHSWVTTGYDMAGDKEHHGHCEEEEISEDNFGEVVTFFDITAEEIIEFQKRLK